MANGLSINGVVQPVGFGLGSVVTWSSGGVPNTYMSVFATRTGWKFDSGNAALKSLCQGELIPRVGSPSAFAPANTCGIDGSMACNYGSPESALSGLGGLGAAFCTPLNDALRELQNIKVTSYDRLSSASQASLDAVLEDLGGFAVYVPFLGNECERHTAEVRAMVQSLRGELGAAAPPPLRPGVDAGGEPSGMQTWMKVAIGIGIGAVALGALGYSAGNLARLFRGR
ncbi:MAG: hypothetical protein EPN91_08565 [Salinibacterium sp.]|nr:MAG: hypothetical protein EPN91_08565 [Salinibacterium sp.]